MAQILNDRDKALQAAPYRSITDAVTISGTAGTFLASKNTVTILPATITLTATPSGSAYGPNAVYTWTYTTSLAPNTPLPAATVNSGADLKTITINNTDAWLTLATVPPFVTYKCVVTETLLETSYAYYTINFTREASDPVVINLTRTNVLVTCDSNSNPINFDNTNQTITVTRGSALNYNAGSTTPNTFNVSFTATNVSPAAGSGSGTSWVQPAITALAQDGATITYTITVYDSATPPAASTYVRTVVYNKVSNGVIGADGQNLYPVANYDFNGTLPTGVTFPGTVTNLDNSTTTTIQNTATDQNLRLTNLSLIPANSYIISMRVKFISGTWEGAVYYTNPIAGQTESTSFYKTIPQPAIGVWTTINLDMRTLTAGGTAYMANGNISQLRFDFINDTVSQVSIDYISIGKYGVAEATKSTTLSMYVWAQSTQALTFTGAFTYTWNTGVITHATGQYPAAYTGNYWTSTAGTAPGNGYTLYQRNIVLSDVGTAVTTSANWNSSTVNTIGFRNDGTIGLQGDSARTAYVVTREVWTNAVAPTSNGILAPTIAVSISATTVTTNIATISAPLPIIVGTKITGTGTTGVITAGDYYVKTVISATQVTLSRDSTLATTLVLTTATGNFTGTTNSWSLTATSTLTDGQYMYQSDGILNNSTNIIAWGMPYLSNLKVGNLSALSANLGTVDIFTGGALRSGKTSFDSTAQGFFLGNDGGTPKFKIGTASDTASLAFDSGTGILTLKGGSYLNSAGATLLSSTTVPNDILNSAAAATADSKISTALTTAANDAAAKVAAANPLVVIPSTGMTVVSNTFTKSGTTTGWNEQVYSKDGYSSGCYLSFVPGQVNKNIIVGLNTTPATSASFGDMQYSWYLVSDGTLQIFESNTPQVLTSTVSYTASDILSIIWDGSNVRYYKNGGTAIRTVPLTNITTAYYFDSTFNEKDASINKVQFGPLTSNNWTSILGTGRPEDYATLGATAANLKVGTGNNLCVNSDFTSTANWTLGSYLITATVGLNLSLTYWTLNKGIGEGTGTIYITQGSTGTDITSPGYAELHSEPIAVVPGNTYFLSGYSGAQRCTISIFVYYYDTNNNIIGNSTGTINNGTTYTGGTLLSNYYRHKEKVIPPANTAYIHILLRKGSNNTVNDNSYAFFTRVMFEETGPAAIEPGNWCAPGVGSVTTTAISNAASAAATAISNAATAQNSADDRLSKTGNSIMQGAISLQSQRAIYVGDITNGLYLGASGIVGVNAGNPKFAVDANGNASFAGNITGATGEFAGTLRAGVLDFTQLAGVSNTYYSSQAFQVPTGKTTMRVTLVAGGGGGGGGNARAGQISTTSQGGGGGGVLGADGTNTTVLYSGLTAGAWYYVTIGAGGTAGSARDGVYSTGSPGTNGGNTFVNPGQSSNSATKFAQATGGTGGGQAGVTSGGQAGTPSTLQGVTVVTAGTYYNSTYTYTEYQGKGGSIPTTQTGTNLYGGNGGKNRYSTGGIGGIDQTPATNATGYGGGGGGGGGQYAANPSAASAGTSGLATIEFFDPNTVVLKTEFDALKANLRTLGVNVT